MNIGGFIPLVIKHPGHRHPAAQQQLHPNSPITEIRKGDDHPPANAQQLFEHMFGAMGGLEGLTQNGVIKGIIGIIHQITVSIPLHCGKTAFHTIIDPFAGQFDTTAIDLAGIGQKLQQLAIAATDIDHPCAGLDHLGNHQKVGTGG